MPNPGITLLPARLCSCSIMSQSTSYETHMAASAVVRRRSNAFMLAGSSCGWQCASVSCRFAAGAEEEAVGWLVEEDMGAASGDLLVRSSVCGRRQA